MEKPKVIFKNVYKEYSMLRSNKDKLIDFFIPQKGEKSFFAVKDVSFEVYPGETIGIIGINGSGKSTISNMLAEVIPPTSGDIELDGETSLIAISVGLNSQLSGLENIHLKCMMHGMSEVEIEKVTPKIIEFADIGSFIEQPVKNYSSGMRSRLGFAISVHTDPDIMVVDEALSVGDETFYNKCMDKVNEFKKLGKTIFFVSHSVTQMRKISDRVMWIHYGEMKEFGETNKVLNNYKAFIKWFKELDIQEQKSYKEEMFTKQTIINQREKEGRVRTQVDKKNIKKQRWYGVQLTILSFIFLIMSTLIISGTPIRTGWNNITTFAGMGSNKQIETNHQAEKADLTKPIMKYGYVVAEKVPLYKDAMQNNSNKTLQLFDEVYVNEEVDTFYKVTSEQAEGYIDKTLVDIDQKIEVSSLSVEELLPYLNEEFKGSYLYYLAFIGQKINVVNDKLVYFESLNDTDNVKVLQSSEGSLRYCANEKEILTRLEVPMEFELSTETDSYIKENSIKSIDSEKYYIETDVYSYLFDFERNTVTFIVN